MNKIAEVEAGFMKKDITNFNVGDTVKVFVKIKEGDKTRIQAFEGIVIAKKGSGLRESFTVRRISYGEGVERVFQLHSPLIDSISVEKKGKVKRAKLYYIRKRIGKRTKVEEAAV
ncbi:MAG: 50S ribosomal protein L19 [Candidatus Omnitrophica bacterium]|nr:50S ribosomal protein L19 [Candidatus Omnitrophota bacterium]